MKDNMFMALSTALLNSVSLAFLPVSPIPEAALMALSGIGSPFLSIWLLKIYIRSDDPPELTRRIAALKGSIKCCEADLKKKGNSLSFYTTTQQNLENLRLELQQVRTSTN